jgi:hypothetical protein
MKLPLFGPAQRLVLGTTLLLLFGSITYAKRGPKPIVPPLQVNGIEFRAPNLPQSEGIIEAWDPKSNTLLWSKRAYKSLKDPLTELDVQWVFIKAMTLAENNRDLVIVDERGRTHFVSIAAPVAHHGKWNYVVIALTLAILVTLALRAQHRRNDFSRNKSLRKP